MSFKIFNTFTNFDFKKHDEFKTLSFLLLSLVMLGVAGLLSMKFSKPPSAITPEPIATSTLSYVPQFVLISFDGSKSIETWKHLRYFKVELKAASTTVNFTHFINAAYFLTEANKTLYAGPGKLAGKSNIGFSEDFEHIRMRVHEVNLAIQDGDEIAPHTVGHFSGATWTKEQWEEELGSFNRVMFGLDEIYPDAHLEKLQLVPSEIIGFRAPYLDKSPGLYRALHALHYKYDTSEVGTRPRGVDLWPTRDDAGLWHIPLGLVFLGPKQRTSLAMDYNFYAHDSDAKDLIKKGTPEWQRVYDETLIAFLDYFDRNYKGARAPVLVGWHFSQKWNDGVYWQVMKDFARQVCGKPEVQCGTFKELVEYMDTYGVPQEKKVQSAAAADAVTGIEQQGATVHEAEGKHDE